VAGILPDLVGVTDVTQALRSQPQGDQLAANGAEIARGTGFGTRRAPGAVRLAADDPSGWDPVCHCGRECGAQAASRRRAFCTDGSAPFARATGRARKSTLAGLAAILISSPVAGLRPIRAF